MRQEDTEAGFTLIELLVAFLLLGFLMSLLYASFSFANRVTAKTVENSEKSFELFQTQEFLRELLGSIYPAQNAFQGTQGRMTFLAPLNRQGVAKGLYEITLQREYDDFTLSWQATFTEDSAHAKGSVVLVGQIKGVEFSYLDGGLGQSEEIWTSSWDQEGDLPTHIRLTLDRKSEGWPEQIIKINVSQNIDCMYDPVSRGCIYR